MSGLSPEIMGLGPVEASVRRSRRAGMTIGDIDLVEINEAFAAQVIPRRRDLGIDDDRLNVHGGAIAVGHPFGMTGARIATTLLNGLQERDAVRARDDVRRRRPGHGDDPRAALLTDQGPADASRASRARSAISGTPASKIAALSSPAASSPRT